MIENFLDFNFHYRLPRSVKPSFPVNCNGINVRFVNEDFTFEVQVQVPNLQKFNNELQTLRNFFLLLLLFCRRFPH